MWEAWRRVKANRARREWTVRVSRSSSRSEEQPLQDLESDELGDLVPAPGHGGGDSQAAWRWGPRAGVPTIADRVAQTVVARQLEERADHRFHPDSYGYRPNKSAHQALAACRQRCWRYDWAIDLDVQKFFDTVPWDLVVKAVEAVTDCRWVLLYVKRWLAAPLVRPDGALEQRGKGTPQGSAVSPILANLFMHYAFDAWMARNIPGCPFERYADDAIVHCKTRRQAEHVLDRIAQRMSEVGLTLHPEKTRIVYCKDGRRRAQHQHTAFTFLGFAFRGRGARSRNGRIFNGFLPAISPEALKAKSVESAECGFIGAPTCRWMTWRGGEPIASGWINYYGRFRSGPRSIPSSSASTST